MCKYSANFRKKSGMSKQYREKTPKSYPIITALSFKNSEIIAEKSLFYSEIP